MSDSKQRTLLYAAGLLGAAAVVGGVLVFATARRSEAQAEAQRRKADLAAGPHVVAARATLSSAERRVELQAEARPYASVTLYSKVSGYLRAIRVDKGDRVKAGQVLAVIESPELDRQYDAALADARFQRVNAKRSASLVTPGVVSTRDAELDASRAAMAEAQLQALAQQKEYETIRAPFAGTVTARYADPGALVQSAATAQTGALPFVTVAQIERLRVSAYVDQRDAAYVHPGDTAEVAVPDRPSVRVTGRVSRVASQLDAKTRTMLVEIDVDNRKGDIVPGSFVSVSLVVPRPPMVEVPVEALVMRARQALVPVIGAGATVRFRPVVVGEDDGARVRIRSGLSAGEVVALDLGERVADGAHVRMVMRDGQHAANK